MSLDKPQLVEIVIRSYEILQNEGRMNEELRYTLLDMLDDILKDCVTIPEGRQSENAQN